MWWHSFIQWMKETKKNECYLKRKKWSFLAFSTTSVQRNRFYILIRDFCFTEKCPYCFLVKILILFSKEPSMRNRKPGVNIITIDGNSYQIFPIKSKINSKSTKTKSTKQKSSTKFLKIQFFMNQTIDNNYKKRIPITKNTIIIQEKKHVFQIIYFITVNFFFFLLEVIIHSMSNLARIFFSL